ncbi:MAG: hypothetical protein OCD76_14120 [Reichenbachiella sp.]
MNSLLIALGTIVTLMIGWVVIQKIWITMFADEVESEDALADRSKCGQCNCGTICKKIK